MVKFCPQCNNLFGHKINKETDKLSYVCMSCNNIESVVDHCIIINELNTTVQDYPLNINMIYDVTLPRTNKIPCPNPTCPCVAKSEKPEIIIFQYNPNMLKTAYMCTQCKTYWKN